MTTDGDREGDSVFTYDVSTNESLSEGVVAAIATASGVDPTPRATAATDSERALEPLFSAVDPDALDSVFRPAGDDEPRSAGRVSFHYHGYEVTVHSDGRISLERPEPTSPGAAY